MRFVDTGKFSTTGNSTRAIAANPTPEEASPLIVTENRFLYEVSLNEGDDAGYAIVSGDERVPGVIAYVEHVLSMTLLTNKRSYDAQRSQRLLISKVKAVDVVIDFCEQVLKLKYLQRFNQ